MKLSERLERVAQMVTEGNRLADVGTDHGYVPIWLYRQKRIPSAIAMDYHEGPLMRAKSHIQEAGLEAYIETRRSDGLEALLPGETDTVLIAGMGGILMEAILNRGRDVLSAVRELVLQPQSEIAGVRQWLERNGWRIICEDMVKEDGKYYFLMKAVPGREKNYTIPEYRYGRLMYQRSLPVLEEYLRRQRKVNQKIIQGLPKEENQRISAREEFLQRDLRLLEEALEGCSTLQREQSARAEERSLDGKRDGAYDNMSGID